MRFNPNGDAGGLSNGTLGPGGNTFNPNIDLTKVPGVKEENQWLYEQIREKGQNEDWNQKRQQYATSSYGAEHDMNPGLIVAPSGIPEIVATLKYAKTNNRAVAIRSGGHQYSGASSTGNENILLDLSNTFPEKPTKIEKDGQTQVRTSVSWPLVYFNQWLGGQGLFVPHGQCAGVFVGGHVQTGGYGQLGRNFGLLGDHVVSLEIVDPDAADSTKILRKDNDAELFNAFLGGSPGNFGVLTHFTINVYHDEQFEGCQGLWALHLYEDKVLHNLLTEVIKLNDDDDKPRGYDLCVSVVSETAKPWVNWQDLKDKFVQAGFDRIKGGPLEEWHLRFIIVYAQWVPHDNDKFDPTWFNTLRSGAIFPKDTTDPSQWAPNRDFFGRLKPRQPTMSDMTAWWILHAEREFEYPYIKRTYVTNSKSLGSDKWVDWVLKTLHPIMNNKEANAEGLFISAQFQPFGGKNSQYFNNGPEPGKHFNGTSYSWRDATMIATIDCFHREEIKYAKAAVAWQCANDVAMSPGGEAKFVHDRERRLFWGSYSKGERTSDFDISTIPDVYFDTKEKYDKLRALRAKVDPTGLYTPNKFCVPNTVAPPPAKGDDVQKAA